MSCNVGEVAVVSLATDAGTQLSILPLQIFFLNLMTDIFPALALGVGEGDEGTMRRPPRDPPEPVLSRRHWIGIGGYGVVFAGAVLAALFWATQGLGLEGEAAVTVSFLTLAFGQLWHVFNMRQPTSGVFFQRGDPQSLRVGGGGCLRAAPLRGRLHPGVAGGGAASERGGLGPHRAHEPRAAGGRPGGAGGAAVEERVEASKLSPSPRLYSAWILLQQAGRLLQSAAPEELMVLVGSFRGLR